MSLPVTTTAARCEAVLDEIQRVVVGRRPALTLIQPGSLSDLVRSHWFASRHGGLGRGLREDAVAPVHALDVLRDARHVVAPRDQ